MKIFFPLFSVFPARKIPPVFRFSFRFRPQIGGCRSTVPVGAIYGSAPILPPLWFLLPMLHSFLPVFSHCRQGQGSRDHNDGSADRLRIYQGQSRKNRRIARSFRPSDIRSDHPASATPLTDIEAIPDWTGRRNFEEGRSPMKDTMEYNGYFGSVHYNADDKVFYG